MQVSERERERWCARKRECVCVSVCVCVCLCVRRRECACMIVGASVHVCEWAHTHSLLHSIVHILFLCLNRRNTLLISTPYPFPFSLSFSFSLRSSLLSFSPLYFSPHPFSSCGHVVCSVCSPSGDKIPGDGINRSTVLKDMRIVLPHLGDLGLRRVCLHCYMDS